MGEETESSSAPVPSHAELVEDLKSLRRPGLAGLRRTRVLALRRAAELCGLCHDSDDVPAAVEELLRHAVRRLGEQDALGRAAAHTFGLVAGRRGDAAQDRRKAAAQVYGVTPDTFRKKQEVEVLAQIAEAVRAVCRERRSRDQRPETAREQESQGEQDTERPFRVKAMVADAPVSFTLHVMPVDLLRDIDILVSSENVYLEMSKTFVPTLSGALRRAGAVRNGAGEVIRDVLAEELADWARRHGRPGLPVRPGTVVPTSPGALADQGVRRIYHAAVAVPLGGRDGYEVAPDDIARAVREAFALARAERQRFDPPLSSICFPLMGTGRGRLPLKVSASWIGWAVHEELIRDPDWSVHLVTRNLAVAQAIADL